MQYKRTNDYRIEIDLEALPIIDMLLLIALKSYETATPRGMGYKQKYIHLVEETPDFKENIEYENEQPVMLVMDYINGRDCRTKVYLARDGKWYFDAYAFQQRKVTSEEFLNGIVRDPADKFLDKVIEELE